MGFLKDRLITEQGQGWSFVDGEFACSECVEEPYLKQWVSRHADEQACSYCERHSAEMPLGVAVNELFAFVDEGLRFEFDEALESYPYDSEDKAFVGSWWTSYELADDLELFGNERLRERFVNSFDARMFCPHNPYGVSESAAFMSGWRRFVEHVKHQARYYFPTEPAVGRDGDGRRPDELRVNEIPTYLGDAVRELDLIREIGGGEPLYRARLGSSGETFQSARQLGTPPTNRATWANRMSPAGIAMFYGAADEQTAIAEVYEPGLDPLQSAKVSVGRFNASRPLHVIDLTGVLGLPSLFDQSARHLREKVRLLREFAEAIAEPIQKDGKEHIEYVPTQVVTEYFRDVFPVEGGTSIDGIMYGSSRRRGGVCYVLFVDNEHCVDGEPEPKDDGKLRLVLPPDRVEVVEPRLGGEACP